MQITNPADGQELWTGPIFFNIGGAGTGYSQRRSEVPNSHLLSLRPTHGRSVLKWHLDGCSSPAEPRSFAVPAGRSSTRRECRFHTALAPSLPASIVVMFGIPLAQLSGLDSRVGPDRCYRATCGRYASRATTSLSTYLHRAAGVGLTVGYTHVDSLIVIDKQSAVEAFTKSEARSAASVWAQVARSRAAELWVMKVQTVVQHRRREPRKVDSLGTPCQLKLHHLKRRHCPMVGRAKIWLGFMAPMRIGWPRPARAHLLLHLHHGQVQGSKCCWVSWGLPCGTHPQHEASITSFGSPPKPSWRRTRLQSHKCMLKVLKGIDVDII